MRCAQSILLPFLFALGEIDSLTSLTLGEGRESKPPGSGKVKAALGGHGLRLRERICETLVSCLVYLFCRFLISKRANAFLLHVRATQQSKLQTDHDLHEGGDGVYERTGSDCQGVSFSALSEVETESRQGRTWDGAKTICLVVVQ